ncbi:MAG: hypothetical protein K0U52_00325 [Gammaproteobacteria bacterium]|nr:hypothetical protein [Gammaproteobacteria bacterium]
MNTFQMQGVERQDRRNMVFDVPSLTQHVAPTAAKWIGGLRKKICKWAENEQHRQIGLVMELGTYDNGQWHPGIPKALWEDVVCQFLECEDWTEAVETKWSPSHEYQYVLGNGRIVQSSCVFNSNQQIQVHHKEQKVTQTRHAHIVTRDMEHDLRIQMVEEQEMVDSDLPQTVYPSSVTLQQKMSFTFRHWTFDVVRSWTGPTRSEAERMQQVGHCVYTIYVHSRGESLESYIHQKSDLYIATSCFMKICALFEKVFSLDLYAH